MLLYFYMHRCDRTKNKTKPIVHLHRKQSNINELVSRANLLLLLIIVVLKCIYYTFLRMTCLSIFICFLECAIISILFLSASVALFRRMRTKCAKHCFNEDKRYETSNFFRVVIIKWSVVINFQMRASSLTNLYMSFWQQLRAQNSFVLQSIRTAQIEQQITV